MSDTKTRDGKIKAERDAIKDWLVLFNEGAADLQRAIRAAPVEGPNWKRRMSVHICNRTSDQVLDVVRILQAEAMLALERYRTGDLND